MQNTTLPLKLKIAPDDSRILSQISSLAAFDFSRINADVRHKYHWSPQKCKALELRTKQFMALSFLSPGGIHTPSAEVDEYWHRMILHTKWYAHFCDSVFGRFFHHNVELPVSDQSAALPNSTRTLLSLWFEESKGKAPVDAAQCNNTNCNTTNCNTTNCNNTNCNNDSNCNNDANCNNEPDSQAG